MKPGRSRAAISSNIRELLKSESNRTQDQAVAIALKNARKYADGGAVASDYAMLRAMLPSDPRSDEVLQRYTVLADEPRNQLMMGRMSGTPMSPEDERNREIGVKAYDDIRLMEPTMARRMDRVAARMGPGAPAAAYHPTQQAADQRTYDTLERLAETTPAGLRERRDNIIRGGNQDIEGLMLRVYQDAPTEDNIKAMERMADRIGIKPPWADVPRKYARGGSVAAPKFATKPAKLASGGLNSALPGRSDKLGIGAKPGAFVMPADVVSAVGQGNSKAGMAVLDGMFKSGPYGAHLPRGGARSAVPRRGKPTFADGGVVPIAVSGGEYIIEPEEIIAQFGDIETGHQALEQFAKDQRQDYIKTLRSLPGPRRG